MTEIELKSKNIEFSGNPLSVQDIASMIRNVEDNIADYLYEKYYLDENIFADILKEIDRKYKVKVFILNGDSDIDKEALEHINRELGNWQTVSGGTAILPYYININFAQEDDETAGVMVPMDNSIYINESRNVKSAFRHELAHLNDLDFYDSVNIRDDASTWRQELINAGISESNADYAYQDKLEFVAVSAEGDFSKYSEGFKEYLVTLGMPRWVFNLPVE